MSITIVRSSYYPELLGEMENAARGALKDAGVDVAAVKTVIVPGAFEIPLACKRIIKKRKTDGVVALGIIIQGGTRHAEEIARACTDGLMRVQLETDVPIAHEVLFVDSREQAKARVHRGAEAARTVLAMMRL